MFRPQGTYFVTVDIRPLRPDGDGMAFCRSLPGPLRRGGDPQPGRSTPIPPRAAPGALQLRQAPGGAGGGRLARPGSWCREGGRRPARHRAGRTGRPPSPASPPWSAAAAGTGARLVVLLSETFSTGFSMHTDVTRRARGRPVVAVPGGAGAGARRVGVRLVPRGGGRGRPPRQHARPGGPDGPVHRYRKLHRFAYGGEDRSIRPAPSGSRSRSRACGSACSSATTCASPTSGGRWRRTPTPTCAWPTGRTPAGPLAGAARGPGHREPGVRRACNRVGPGTGRQARLRRRQRHHRPLGEALATGSRTEALLVADVTAERVAEVRDALPFLADRRAPERSVRHHGHVAPEV